MYRFREDVIPSSNNSKLICKANNTQLNSTLKYAYQLNVIAHGPPSIIGNLVRRKFNWQKYFLRVEHPVKSLEIWIAPALKDSSSCSSVL